MKRFTTLMLGTALVAALSFGAQTPSNPTTDNSTKTPVVKKHKKHVKKNAAASSTTNAAPASSTSSAPAKK
jgi:hypothetical protein